MRGSTYPTAVRRRLAAALIFLLAACGPSDEPVAEVESESAAPASTPYRYIREYLFVTQRDEAPLVVPFSFRAVEAGEEYERSVRGWLARGETWDRFIDESWMSSPAGGVWRVVPRGSLRLTAGGPAEIESFRFDSGERRLRLELHDPVTGWEEGADTRFRLVEGTLAIGAEAFPGPVLELLRIEQTLEDGWPPDEDFDAVFLTSGDSIQLVLAETLGGSTPDTEFAWTRTPAGTRSWEEAEIRWIEMRTFEDARREVPLRWSIRIPDALIEGEVEAVGQDAVLGPERSGRRAVEIRYTVMGWIEIDGEPRDVVGTIRHTQQ